MFRFLNTDYFPAPVTWTRRLSYIQSRFYLLNPRIKSHNLLNSLRAGVWTATNKIISPIWEKIEALLIEFRATWILQDNSHSSVLHQFQSRACFSHVFALHSWEQVFFTNVFQGRTVPFMRCSFSWPEILQRHIHPLWNISAIWTRQKQFHGTAWLS